MKLRLAVKDSSGLVSDVAAGHEFTLATGVNYIGGAPDSQAPNCRSYRASRQRSPTPLTALLAASGFTPGRARRGTTGDPVAAGDQDSPRHRPSRNATADGRTSTTP